MVSFLASTTTSGPNAAQCGSQGEGRDQGLANRRWQDDIAKKKGTALYREVQWTALMEGCILQWMDKAKVK